MQSKIEGYTSFPGDHCGSVAMRGLLHHYCGLDLPEAVVFGLGAGVASVYLRGPGLDPSAILFGRQVAMETSVGRNLGVDYREQPEPDDAEAWRVVQEEVASGRPTMLSGDIFYLDYREFKVHFPAHRFVLLGFDDATERVWIADRLRAEAEVCSYGALAKSRNPPEGLSTQNLWGRFHGTDVGCDLVSAARSALAECAREMLGEAEGSDSFEEDGVMSSAGLVTSRGIAGSRAFAADIPSWASREDASWLASFNASCIEKFGTGEVIFVDSTLGFSLGPVTWTRHSFPKRLPNLPRRRPMPGPKPPKHFLRLRMKFLTMRLGLRHSVMPSGRPKSKRNFLNSLPTERLSRRDRLGTHDSVFRAG